MTSIADDDDDGSTNEDEGVNLSRATLKRTR